MVNFVGFSTFDLLDDNGVAFPMAVMYPTLSQEKETRIGPYVLNVAMKAHPSNTIAPLVVISHGSGGFHLAHRTLAHHLAQNGFVVGMPEHPFNNRNNDSLAGTIQNMIDRPKLISASIDWFLKHSEFNAILNPDAISLIGHSMGGYTALALSGGVPTALPNESPEVVQRQLCITHDNRIKALVLLAPASVWFRDQNSLNNISIPILMLVGENDEYTGSKCPILMGATDVDNYLPYGYHAQIILSGVLDSTKIQHRLVTNAGHFSFLSLFPENMTNKAFLPSQDPEGFNREEFLGALNIEVLDFLLSNVH